MLIGDILLFAIRRLAFIRIISIMPMWLEIIKMSFESLMAKKSRSILSMLGIIIGVSTVIAVFAIGQGAQQAVDDQFAGLSAKTIIVMRMSGRGATASSKLEVEDAQIIREKAVNIETVTGAIQGNGTVAYGSASESYGIVGTDLDFFVVSKLEPVAGRLFTESEMAAKSKVALLGSDVVAALFADDEDPIGATITINNKKIEVIGIFAETGSSMGRTSKDETIYLPYQTAKGSILGTGGMTMLTMEATSVDTVEAATAEITAILRNEHKLKISQEDDFNIMDAGSMVGAAQESAALMTFLLTAIAAITLLVSGIGIMNVMFVTVAERTKEIGIAKAIGGKRSDILSQFLLESVILSMIGGVIGIIIGQIAIPILSNLNILSMSASITGPIIGFSFSVLVGIFFGFYPAFKASRLDPVDALRSE